MDIQISVYKEHNDYGRLVSEICFTKLQNREIVFNISEYGSYYLIATINKESDVLIIETSEGEKEIYSQEKVYLTKHLDEDSLVPGYYRIKLKVEDVWKKFLYEVRLETLEYKHLENIKNILEARFPNITKDLLSSKSNNFSKTLKTASDFEIYNFISKHSDELIFTLNSIKKNPITLLEKEYKKLKFSKRPDKKTYRYYDRKGINPTLGNYESRPIHLEKRVTYTSDLPENRWLLQVLEKIILIFEKNLKKLISEIDYLNKTKIKYTEELVINNASHRKILYSKNVSLVYKKNLSLTMNLLNKNIIESDKEIKVLKDYVSNITNEKAAIISFLNSDFFKELTKRNIPIRNKMRILKDKRYSWINDFLDRITSYGDKFGNEIEFFRNKPSWLLFEYYAFYIYIEILLELGFKLKDSSENEEHSILGMKSESEITFEKDDVNIKLIYDKEIREVRGDREGFDSTLTQNRRPDILMSFYKNEEIKAAIISEIKCCKSKNIYNKEYPTKNYNQIKNYLNIAYMQSNKGLLRGIVKNVMVLYPMQNELINNDKVDLKNEIVFLPIEANEEIKSSKGYEDVKRRVENIIYNYL